MGGNSPVICLKSATALNDPGISVSYQTKTVDLNEG